MPRMGWVRVEIQPLGRPSPIRECRDGRALSPMPFPLVVIDLSQRARKLCSKVRQRARNRGICRAQLVKRGSVRRLGLR